MKRAHLPLPAARPGFRLDELDRNGVARVAQPVVLIHVHQFRLEAGQLLVLQHRVRADDDDIAGIGLVGGGTVHGNNAGAGLGADRVGRETLPVVNVIDLDLLVLADIRGIQQMPVDRHRPLVVQLRMGHADAVQFRSEQYSLHSIILPRIPADYPGLAAGIQIELDIIDQARGAEISGRKDHELTVIRPAFLKLRLAADEVIEIGKFEVGIVEYDAAPTAFQTMLMPGGAKPAPLAVLAGEEVRKVLDRDLLIGRGEGVDVKGRACRPIEVYLRREAPAGAACRGRSRRCSGSTASRSATSS